MGLHTVLLPMVMVKKFKLALYSFLFMSWIAFKPFMHAIAEPGSFINIYICINLLGEIKYLSSETNFINEGISIALIEKANSCSS